MCIVLVVDKEISIGPTSCGSWVRLSYIDNKACHDELIIWGANPVWQCPFWRANIQLLSSILK